MSFPSGVPHSAWAEKQPLSQAIRYPLIIALLLWLVKSTFILVTPIRALAMTPWLIDDSFIIMRIARNFALNRGYSFDGVELTSGAPLLWTVLTSVNHYYWSLEVAAKATVIESAFLGSMALLLVFYIAYHQFNLTIAWVAFGLSGLSQPLFYNSGNGMETSLFAVLGLGAIAVYIKSDGRSHSRHYLWLGCLVGLATLTRFDGLFLAIPILCLEGMALLKNRHAVDKSRWLYLGYFLVSLAIFMLPAILWSLYQSDSLLPSNQTGRRFLAWGSAIELDGGVVWDKYIDKVGSNIPKLFQLLSIAVGSSAVAIIALIVGWQKAQSARFSQVTALYLCFYFTALVAYQGYFPDVHGLRYLYLLGHLLNVSIAAFLFHLVFGGEKRTFSRYSLLVGLVAGLIWAGAYQYERLIDDLSWTDDMELLPLYETETVSEWWAFIDWVNSNLPSGTLIAAKDHGRLAYFTEARIIDLAGIIDPAVIVALRQNNLPAYLHEKKVQYVILPEKRGKTVHKAIRETNQLEQITDAPAQEATDYWLYHLVP